MKRERNQKAPPTRAAPFFLRLSAFQLVNGGFPVNGEHRAVGRVQGAHGLVNAGLQLLVALLQGEGTATSKTMLEWVTPHTTRKSCMEAPGTTARRRERTCSCSLLVRSSSVTTGSQVDDQMDAQLGFKIPLNVVNNVVADQDVPLRGHLAVDGGKALALSIVVHRQIVDAEDALVREDFLIDLLHQLRVGGHTQQGVPCLHNELHAGDDDKNCHCQAQNTVQGSRW